MIETIAFIFTGLGLAASIIYYANILQNANKNQKTQQKTRNAQFFMQFVKELHTPNRLIFWAQMQQWEWKDFIDFERKYGSVDHPELFGERYSLWSIFNDLGWLVENETVDVADVNALVGQSLLWSWEKYESIILERRQVYNYPDELIYWERLCKKILEYRKQQKVFLESPENYDDFLSTIKPNP